MMTFNEALSQIAIDLVEAEATNLTSQGTAFSYSSFLLPLD